MYLHIMLFYITFIAAHPVSAITQGVFDFLRNCPLVWFENVEATVQVHEKKKKKRKWTKPQIKSYACL